VVLLFDIGGTKTRFATSNDGNLLFNIKIIDTPKIFEEGIKEFIKYFEEIDNPEIEKVSGGSPGPLNKDRTMIINAPNLSTWNNKPLKIELEKFFKTNVFLENDADLAGLGEAIKGAGKNYKINMYLTISTGVGGVRIMNGKIDENTFGFEPGHQYIPLRTENKLINLEDLISGSALQKKYGKHPEKIEDEKVWDECAYYLALGIHNSMLHWSPEIVVLGGKVMNKISLNKVRENLREITKIFPEIPEIKKAELGDHAGLYGALALSNKIK
jgi:predicted NBD/HSP70 family sugar kinase